MEQTAILVPVLAMLALSMVVWFVMIVVRVRYFTKHPPPGGVMMNTRTPVEAALDEHSRAVSENFLNLCEVPVLFYALAFLLYLAEAVDSFYVILAWVFVVARCAHSWIHCTYNNGMHRFPAYGVACIALWLMLLRAVYQLLIP